MKKLSNFIFFGLLVFCSCNSNPPKKDEPVITAKKDSVVLTAPIIVNKDSLLISTGKSVLQSLKDKDYKRFAGYFAPQEKIRFSPYGFINTNKDVALSATAFLDFLSINQKLLWGEQDGSGDSIFLSIPEYFAKFVYNADFLLAEQYAVDKFIGTGNSLNNLEKIYPNERFVEYHFPGFDKKYGGMDWTSLRLVFTWLKEKYYLIAVVHDQWTS